jgi:hypothetical protein
MVDNIEIACMFCGRVMKMDTKTKKPKPCPCHKEETKPQVTGLIDLKILCYCPNCEEMIDVFSETEEYETYGFEHQISCWDMVTECCPKNAFECTCPHCKTVFEVTDIDY